MIPGGIFFFISSEDEDTTIVLVLFCFTFSSFVGMALFREVDLVVLLFLDSLLMHFMHFCSLVYSCISRYGSFRWHVVRSSIPVDNLRYIVKRYLWLQCVGGAAIENLMSITDQSRRP